MKQRRKVTLDANEAVASYLTEKHAGFLRRSHAEPDPGKLRKFAEFARSLGLNKRNAFSKQNKRLFPAWSIARSTIA